MVIHKFSYITYLSFIFLFILPACVVYYIIIKARKSDLLRFVTRMSIVWLRKIKKRRVKNQKWPRTSLDTECLLYIEWSKREHQIDNYFKYSNMKKKTLSVLVWACVFSLSSYGLSHINSEIQMKHFIISSIKKSWSFFVHWIIPIIIFLFVN